MVRRLLASTTAWRWRRDNALVWSGFPLTLGAVVVAVALATVLFRHTYIGVDDANIAMVYARNLAAGHGFVYNVGGERVEGFTSLLSVLLTAGVITISPLPELSLLGVGVLLASLAVFLPLTTLGAFIRNGPPERAWLRPLQLLILAWAVGSPAFIIWTTVSLMDTGLWTFLWSCSVTVILYEIANPEPSRSRLALMSTLAFLLPLTRPEGFAAGPVFILAYAFARRRHATTWRGVAPSLLVPGLAWLVAVAGITAFRIGYFGFPLPNTYYAKVPPELVYRLRTGIQYLAEFVSAQRILMSLVLGAIAAGLVLNARLAFSIVARGSGAEEADAQVARVRTAHFTVALLAVAGLLLPVYGGGDHLAGFRFYQPVWPVLSLPIILLGLDISLTYRGTVRSIDHQRLAWMVALATLPMLVILPARPWSAQPHRALLDEFEIAEDGRRLGAALNRLFPTARPYVGVTAAGGVQYTYQGPVFDLLGLNHVRMGHSPGARHGYRNHAAFNKNVFWSVAAPVVLPVLCPGPIDDTLAAREFRKLSDDILQGIFRDRAFEDRYRLVTVRGDGQHQVFDQDPWFFMPRWFPHSRLQAGDYQDATLIAYVEGNIVARLTAQGWGIEVLSGRGNETDIADTSGVGPCPPRTTLKH